MDDDHPFPFFCLGMVGLAVVVLLVISLDLLTESGLLESETWQRLRSLWAG